jgi:hypothetical protein
VQRRRLLALAGTATVPLAGCSGPLDGSASGTDADADTDAAPPSSTDASGSASDATAAPSPDRILALGDSHEFADGTTLTVRNVAIRKLVPSTTADNAAHVDVACLDGRQFVVVDAEVARPGTTDAGSTDAGESALADLWFDVTVDGRRYPGGPGDGYRVSLPDRPARPGVPAVPVPTVDATDVAVVPRGEPFAGVRWRLPPGPADLLGRAPAFEVESFRVPRTVAPGEAVAASFTVANTGARDGEFVVEFGVGGVPDHPETTVEVPAGETVTVEESLAHDRADGEEVTVVLNWGCAFRQREVTVFAGSLRRPR